MKIIPFFIVFGLIMIGCKRKSGNATEESIDTSHFFQTAVIFGKDIKELETTPYFIYKIDIVNDRKDSTAINTPVFKQLAERFIKPDITSQELKPQYKESIFEDKTTGGFNINYSTLNKDLEVQSVNILLKEDGATVKNIFIRKFYTYTDSSAIEQMTWKPNERFQIIRSVQKKDGTENNYQTLVVWNEKNKD